MDKWVDLLLASPDRQRKVFEQDAVPAVRCFREMELRFCPLRTACFAVINTKTLVAPPSEESSLVLRELIGYYLLATPS